MSLQGYHTPLSDRGYATPVSEPAYPPHSFHIAQKLDSLMSEVMEQKQFLIDTRREATQLSEGLSQLSAEVSNLKDQLHCSETGKPKSKKKIPLDLSVRHVFTIITQ